MLAGTSDTPVQENLRWGCDRKTADNICNFNRHYAEFRGYWQSTKFLEDARKEYEANGIIKFYDSNTGKLLYEAPKGRSFEDFIKESLSHGWPSFRDEEVVWDNVRVLPDGETVSLQGMFQPCLLYLIVRELELTYRENWRDSRRNASWPQPSRRKRKSLLHQPGLGRWQPNRKLILSIIGNVNYSKA